MESHKFTSLDENKLNNLNKIHSNKYSYREEVNSGVLDIKCDKHGWFNQSYWNHTYGHGCKNCNISKGELSIENYLTEQQIEFEREKKFSECINKRMLPFDFYLTNLNICIEYDGEHHYNEN